MARTHNWSTRRSEARDALAVLLFHLVGAPCPKCSFDDYVHCDFCGNGSGSGPYYERDYSDMRGGHRHGEPGGSTSVTVRLSPRLLSQVDRLVDEGTARTVVIRNLIEQALLQRSAA